jgi:hypothetical protein
LMFMLISILRRKHVSFESLSIEITPIEFIGVRSFCFD